MEIRPCLPQRASCTCTISNRLFLSGYLDSYCCESHFSTQFSSSSCIPSGVLRFGVCRCPYLAFFLWPVPASPTHEAETPLKHCDVAARLAINSELVIIASKQYVDTLQEQLSDMSASSIVE